MTGRQAPWLALPDLGYPLTCSMACCFGNEFLGQPKPDMIVFSIGIPGHFADWCDAVVARIIRYLDPGSREIHGNSLEEIDEALSKSKISHAVVYAPKPKRALHALLKTAGTPFVVALDDPRRSVGYAMDRYQLALAPAMRIVCESCAAIADLPVPKVPLVLHAEHHGRDLVQTAMALIRHLCGIEADPLKIFRQIGGNEGAVGLPIAKQVRRIDNERLLEDWWGRFGEREQIIVDSAFASYAGFFMTQPFREITWCRELFRLGDQPAVTAIDVTGPARCLFYGPYMFLPSGPWTARIFLGFAIETTIPPLLIEVVTGNRVVARKSVHPNSTGIFELTIDFTIENADVPVETRIFNERAAFDGRLALGYVVVAPQKQQAPFVCKLRLARLRS